MTERTTRERVMDAALRLFAERGYRGTTIGAIEEAAGLTPRAGGLYRHFAGKREVLEAAIIRHIGYSENVLSAVELMPLGDLRSELVLLGRWTLHLIGTHRDLIRILQRDGDQFPDLVQRYHRHIVRRGHDEATEWLRRYAQRAGLQDIDYEAVAAMAIGILVNYRLDQILFGHPPGDLDEERLLQAWVEVWLRFLRQDGAGDTKEAVHGHTNA